MYQVLHNWVIAALTDSHISLHKKSFKMPLNNMSKLSYTKIPTEYRWHKTKTFTFQYSSVTVKVILRKNLQCHIQGNWKVNTPMTHSRLFKGQYSSVTFKVIWRLILQCHIQGHLKFNTPGSHSRSFKCQYSRVTVKVI